MKIKMTSDLNGWPEELKSFWTRNVSRGFTVAALACRWFMHQVTASNREILLGSKMQFEKVCERVREYSNQKDLLGDLNLFTDFVVMLIKLEIITKDEAIEILKPWPYTDTLVEVIKYDKPLCVNRWEI